MIRVLAYAIAIFLVLGCVSSLQPKACTWEAKLCPDGSTVGRHGQNCEFDPCPAPVPGPGNPNGCIEGHAWCENKSRCVVSFDPCVANQTAMPGSDRDAHGCIGSAGYTWCEEKQTCLRAWEENCTS